jgi:ATP-dependent protease HslVU (ClpYQ) peptidase subunit
MKSADIVRHSLGIASKIDVYTNDQVVVEELACPS